MLSRIIKNVLSATSARNISLVPGLGSAATMRLMATAGTVAVTGLIVLIIANVFFEFSMIITGTIAFAHAIVIEDKVSIIIFSIVIIFVGLLLTRNEFGCLGRIITSVGVICLVALICISFLLGNFTYGKNSVHTINALGTMLRDHEVVTANLSVVTGGSDSAFLSAPISSRGHTYLAINKLGCSTSSPSAIVAKIESDLNPAFPILARGVRGNSVVEENTIYLGILPIFGDNPVISYKIRNNNHCFYLVAKPPHWLKGIVYHGVVRDRSGSLWLFQYGLYEDQNSEKVVHEADSEPKEYQLATYPMADHMWARMSENVTNYYRDDFPVDCKLKPLHHQ